VPHKVLFFSNIEVFFGRILKSKLKADYQSPLSLTTVIPTHCHDQPIDSVIVARRCLFVFFFVRLKGFSSFKVLGGAKVRRIVEKV
jgi:hypothetical protein